MNIKVRIKSLISSHSISITWMWAPGEEQSFSPSPHDKWTFAASRTTTCPDLLVSQANRAFFRRFGVFFIELMCMSWVSLVHWTIDSEMNHEDRIRNIYREKSPNICTLTEKRMTERWFLKAHTQEHSRRKRVEVQFMRTVRVGKGHRSTHYWPSMIVEELKRQFISTCSWFS